MNTTSKLTPESVTEIADAYLAGKVLTELAAQFGVSYQAIPNRLSVVFASARAMSRAGFDWIAKPIEDLVAVIASDSKPWDDLTGKLARQAGLTEAVAARVKEQHAAAHAANATAINASLLTYTLKLVFDWISSELQS